MIRTPTTALHAQPKNHQEPRLDTTGEQMKKQTNRHVDVNMSPSLSFFLIPITLSIYPSTYLAIHLAICPSIYPSTYLSIYPPIYLASDLSIYLSIHACVYIRIICKCIYGAKVPLVQ